MRSLVRFRMRRPAVAAVLALAAAVLAPAALAASPNLVVSQVYGGGGNSGAPLTHDYVELFNRGAAPVSLDGLSIQYASATGTGNFGANAGQLTELPAVMLQPGQYFLVQQAAGAGNGVPLPTPDHVDPTPIAMAAGAGKVALATGTATLGCNGGSAPCDAAQLARIIDLVGYGNANFFEGTGAAPTLTNTTAAFRAAGGCTDTDDNAADFTSAAPAPRNTASPLNVCPGDPRPAVSSTNPANGATNVALDAAITVTFTEAVTAGAGWYAIECTLSGPHTAVESGGPQTYTLTPTASFVHSETCTVTVTGDRVTDSAGQTMAADHVFSFSTVGPPTRIHEIQGAGHISPLVGQAVSGVVGIVTAKRSNGFYMQDPNPDDDPATSEGIFVFTSFAPAMVEIGDALTVGGNVSEFRPGGLASANLTITQIVAPVISVESSGNALPATTVIGVGGRMPPTEVIHPGSPTGTVEMGAVFDAANHGIDFYESLEGMRVRVDDPVVVGPTNNFGETVVLANDGANASVRTARGGIVVRDLSPSMLGDYRAGDFNPERIMIDDEIVRPLPRAKVGDGYTTSLVGVMDYSFGNHKIQVTHNLTVVDGGLEREVTAAPRDQEIAIATFNVENLHPGSGAQFAQLAELIVHNLRSPDLIGIEEIQDNTGPTNDGTTDASVTWSMLIAAIQAAGGPLYDHRQIDPVDGQDGGQPGGNIRVGFLFRTDRGLSFIDRPGGDSTTPTQVVAHPSGPQLSASPGRVDPTNPAWAASRKPLAGEFRARGKKLFVIVNHFSSKGGDDPLNGRFQPPVRHTEAQRHQQAAVVNDFVKKIVALDRRANVVVLGDINDFDFSETLHILEGNELKTLMRFLPLEERYSYVFEGNAQVLDQILFSNYMVERFPFTYDVVHVNSEFSPQASDHEPQVARVNLIGRP